MLDPLRRLALDAKLRAAEARKKRTEKYDSKRKHLIQELEERERAFKKSRLERDAAEQARERETERIKGEGRRLREEREKEMKQKEEEAEKAERAKRSKKGKQRAASEVESEAVTESGNTGPTGAFPFKLLIFLY